jgi:hypothetical protein
LRWQMRSPLACRLESCMYSSWVRVLPGLVSFILEGVMNFGSGAIA